MNISMDKQKQLCLLNKQSLTAEQNNKRQQKQKVTIVYKFNYLLRFIELELTQMHTRHLFL